MLVQSKADIDSASGQPIRQAAFSGHNSIVRFLIDSKVNVNAPGPFRHLTALHKAIEGEQPETALLLLQNGADPFVRGVGRLSPLLCAGENGLVPVLSKLLELKADINDQTDYGFTALSLAALRGKIDAAKYLVSMRADIHIKTECASPLLHQACESQSTDMVRFIISLGVDIDEQDINGFTAAHLAALRNNVVMLKYLVAHHADVYKQSKSGQSAYSVYGKRADLDKWLVETRKNLTAILLESTSLVPGVAETVTDFVMIKRESREEKRE